MTAGLTLDGTVLSRSFLGAANRVLVNVNGTKINVMSPATTSIPAEGRAGNIALRSRRPSSDGRSFMSAIAHQQPAFPERSSLTSRVSDFLWKHPHVLLAILLAPPLLWLGIIYLGSLIALLLQSFFSIDDYSGLINYEFTLATYRQLLNEANFDIIVRTVLMAAIVTLVSAIIAFPIAYYAARYARGKWKVFFYLGVMLPLWSSYLVKIYAWKLILAKEGILTWILTKLNLLWLLDAWLSLPVIGGNSLSVSYTGTFIVFVYVWMPFMILPIQAALERVPGQSDRGLVRSWRHAATDLPPCAVSAGLARYRRRIDLHVFADAWRLHHSADRRLVAPVHRTGRLCPARHGRQYSACRGIHRRPHRYHGLLPVDGQANGSLRCALTVHIGTSRPEDRCRRRPAFPACAAALDLPLRLHHRGQELSVSAARPDPEMVRGDLGPA